MSDTKHSVNAATIAATNAAAAATAAAPTPTAGIVVSASATSTASAAAAAAATAAGVIVNATARSTATPSHIHKFSEEQIWNGLPPQLRARLLNFHTWTNAKEIAAFSRSSKACRDAALLSPETQEALRKAAVASATPLLSALQRSYLSSERVIKQIRTEASQK